MELAAYYASKGRYSDAFNEYNSLVRSYPYITQYYIEASKYANLAHTYQAGLDLLLSYPDKNNSYITLLDIGKFYQKLNMPEHAISYYKLAEKAMQPEESKELVLTSQYRAYKEIGDSQNMSLILHKIKTLIPGFNPNTDLAEKQTVVVVGKEWKALIDQSIVLAKARNFNKALELLNKAQQIKETPLANQLIGSILFEQGNPNAIIYILKAYKENPTDPDLLNNLVVLYIKQKDYKNAYKYVEELKLVTNEPEKVKKMEEYIVKRL
jgi:tetratricopeptide (TPR) repeat protein